MLHMSCRCERTIHQLKRGVVELLGGNVDVCSHADDYLQIELKLDLEICCKVSK